MISLPLWSVPWFGDLGGGGAAWTNAGKIPQIAKNHSPPQKRKQKKSSGGFCFVCVVCVGDVGILGAL